MPPAAYDLSIVIVNWNTCDLLAGCLQSIADYSRVSPIYPPQRRTSLPTIEIIVVDNASTDGSAAIVRERFPWAELIENQENLGFARANNQAICYSRGRYVMLLNSDTVLHDGAIAAMIAFADAHPEIGVLGPKLIDGRGDIQPSWAKFPSVWSEILAQHRRERKPFADGTAFAVDWMAGACLLVRREAIERVGLMDDRFFLYSEETDWCKRIQDAGWLNVNYPAAVVSHFEGSSSSQDVPRTRFLLYQSKILYAHKHFGQRQALFLKLAFVATSPLKALWALLHGRAQAASAHLQLASRLLQMRIPPAA